MQIQSNVAIGDLSSSRVSVVTCECCSTNFLSWRFLTKANIKVVDDSTVKGKNEINQQLDQEINFLHYFPGEEEV